MTSIGPSLFKAHSLLGQRHEVAQRLVTRSWGIKGGKVAGPASFVWSPKQYAYQADLFATSAALTLRLDNTFGRGAFRRRPVGPHTPFVARVQVACAAGWSNLSGFVGLALKGLILGVSHFWAQVTLGYGLPQAEVIELDVRAINESVSKSLATYHERYTKDAIASPQGLHPQFVRDVMGRKWPSFVEGSIPESKEDFDAIFDFRNGMPEATFKEFRRALETDEETSEASCLLNQSQIGDLQTALHETQNRSVPVQLAVDPASWSYLFRLVPKTRSESAQVWVDAIISKSSLQGGVGEATLAQPVHLRLTVPLGSQGSQAQVTIAPVNRALSDLIDGLER